MHTVRGCTPHGSMISEGVRTPHGRIGVYMKGMVGCDTGDAGWGRTVTSFMGHTGMGDGEPQGKLLRRGVA